MTNVNHILVVFIIFLMQLFWSCGSSTEAEKISDIEEVYQLNSQQKFDEYLVAWRSEIQPIDAPSFNQLSNSEKDVYKIFQEFYNPSDLGKYCTIGRCPEFGNEIYSNASYYIVQNEIRYTLTEFEDNHTVSNFRPNLNLEKPILYLSNRYQQELDSFLDADTYGDDIQNRYEFLNKKLKIFRGHWFGWHFLTHPEVNIIYLNESLDSATVHFRIVYEGGEARFAKINGNWKMYESKLTWIE